MTCTSRILAAVAACLLVSAPLVAQPSAQPSSSPAAAIAVGDRLRIQADSGDAVTGRVTAVDAQSVTVEGRRVFMRRRVAQSIPLGGIQKIERVDSTWSGGWIGVGAALAVSGLWAHAGCDTCGDDNFGTGGRWALYSILTVPIGLSVGHIIDGAINKTVFDRQGGRLAFTVRPTPTAVFAGARLSF